MRGGEREKGVVPFLFWKSFFLFVIYLFGWFIIMAIPAENLLPRRRPEERLASLIFFFPRVCRKIHGILLEGLFFIWEEIRRIIRLFDYSLRGLDNWLNWYTNKLRRIRTRFEAVCLFTKENYFVRVRGNRNSTNLETDVDVIISTRSKAI